jgi:hypothetical protein
MSDLWHEAGADHDLEARQASLAQADAQMMAVYDFVFQAASSRELEHRLAYAGDRIERIAADCGLEPGELEDAARRRYALLREALLEGDDPVAPMLQGGQGGPGGAEKPDEHNEGPDFSHGYSEIPQGPPGGPDPRVTQVAEPQVQQQPAPGTTAARRCVCAAGLTKKGKCRSCRRRPDACSCRTALTSGGTPVTGMPNTGAGGATMPAGAGGATSTPDGMAAGGQLPGAQQAAGAGAGRAGQAGSGFDLTPAQDITAARRDPVRRQVEAVAASVAASNPQLPASECRRVARKVVGGYLHRADLAGSVLSDEPVDSPGPGSERGTGSGSGGMVQHGLEWRGLKSMMPGAGEGAGGMAGLAEAAELAAL